MGLLNKIIIAVVAVGVTACDKSTNSFSVLGASQQFQQSSSSILQKQIDILWVVDNSSSMNPFQSNVATNFNSFMSSFVSKGYDFHVAVTTTDAYLAMPQYFNNQSLAVYRDGVGSVHTGYPVIDVNTPNLLQTFSTNALQGGSGDGDERAFSSMKVALSSPLNSTFLRPGSFLAVIILSDEDDFSDETRPEASWLRAGGVPDHDYADPNLDTVDSYVSFLDGLTNSSATVKNYNVSAVTVLDNNCLAAHRLQSPSTIIGQRYMDLATKTNGVQADICSASYATALTQIQQKILELSTQFVLNRVPVQSSIVVTVGGAVVPNDPANGWTYNSTANSIVFHGTAVPASGASISIVFDPVAPTS